MAPSFAIDFSQSPSWLKVRKLKELRDDFAVHPKVGRALNSIHQIAAAVNDFRCIGGLLFMMVRQFHAVDRSIIRAMQFPEVVVVTNKPSQC